MQPQAWLRLPSDRRQTLTSVGGPKEQWEARVLNISPSGIGLQVPRAFTPGQVLSVQLPGNNGQAARAVLAYVIRAQLQSQQWLLGCSFAMELSEADLAGFGARKERPLGGDVRSWVRFPCDVHTMRTPVALHDGPRWPARIVSHTASGLLLISEREFEPGALLQVDWLNQAGAVQRSIGHNPEPAATAPKR